MTHKLMIFMTVLLSVILWHKAHMLQLKVGTAHIAFLVPFLDVNQLPTLQNTATRCSRLTAAGPRVIADLHLLTEIAYHR